MKLKDWIEIVDPIVDVTIWIENDDEPIFEGNMMDIPWWLIDYEIGRRNDPEEPIYVYAKKHNNGYYNPCIVINLLDKE